MLIVIGVMYPVVLALHSCTRYAVVASLLYTTVRSLYGWLARARYTRADRSVQLFAVAAVHFQVVVGFILYFCSPLLDYFRSDIKAGMSIPELRFFGVVHLACMLIASVVLTIGGAKARRAADDTEKFRTVALYFIAAGVLILLAVPWPFSPFAARPWIRPL